MSPRHPCARNLSGTQGFPCVGLRRHGTPSGVGAPRRSHGYAFGAPPTSPCRGVRSEAYQTCAELP